MSIPHSYVEALDEAPEARGLVPARDPFPEEIVDQINDLGEDGEIVVHILGLGLNYEIEALDSGSEVAETIGIFEPQEA